MRLFYRIKMCERLLNMQKFWGLQWLLSDILQIFDVKHIIKIGEHQQSMKNRINFFKTSPICFTRLLLDTHVGAIVITLVLLS